MWTGSRNSYDTTTSHVDGKNNMCMDLVNYQGINIHLFDHKFNLYIYDIISFIKRHHIIRENEDTVFTSGYAPTKVNIDFHIDSIVYTNLHIKDIDMERGFEILI